jgi:phosphoglucomutase
MEVNHYAGKLAESSMLVNVPKLVTAKLGRKLYEVPVGFKWFVDGLFNGSLGFDREERAGASFVRLDGIVTGASDKSTWVCLLHPPIEGRLESGFEGMDVGHELRVQLVSTDVERGYNDFKKVV